MIQNQESDTVVGQHSNTNSGIKFYNYVSNNNSEASQKYNNNTINNQIQNQQFYDFQNQQQQFQQQDPIQQQQNNNTGSSVQSNNNNSSHATQIIKQLAYTLNDANQDMQMKLIVPCLQKVEGLIHRGYMELTSFFFKQFTSSKTSEFGDFPQLRSLTLNHIGCYYRRRGDFNRAYTFFDQAQKMILNSEIKSNLGLTYLNFSALFSQLGNHKKAFENAKMALIEAQQEFHDYEKTYLQMNERDRENDIIYLAFQQQQQQNQKRDPEYIHKLTTLVIAFHNVAAEEEHQGNMEEALLQYENSCQLANDYLGVEHKISKKFKQEYYNFQQRYAQFRIYDQQKYIKPKVRKQQKDGNYIDIVEQLVQHGYAKKFGTQRQAKNIHGMKQQHPSNNQQPINNISQNNNNSGSRRIKRPKSVKKISYQQQMFQALSQQRQIIYNGQPSSTSIQSFKMKANLSQTNFNKNNNNSQYIQNYSSNTTSHVNTPISRQNPMQSPKQKQVKSYSHTQKNSMTDIQFNSNNINNNFNSTGTQQQFSGNKNNSVYASTKSSKDSVSRTRLLEDLKSQYQKCQINMKYIEDKIQFEIQQQQLQDNQQQSQKKFQIRQTNNYSGNKQIQEKRLKRNLFSSSNNTSQSYSSIRQGNLQQNNNKQQQFQQLQNQQGGKIIYKNFSESIDFLQEEGVVRQAKGQLQFTVQKGRSLLLCEFQPSFNSNRYSIFFNISDIYNHYHQIYDESVELQKQEQKIEEVCQEFIQINKESIQYVNDNIVMKFKQKKTSQQQQGDKYPYRLQLEQNELVLNIVQKNAQNYIILIDQNFDDDNNININKNEIRPVYQQQNSQDNQNDGKQNQEEFDIKPVYYNSKENQELQTQANQSNINKLSQQSSEQKQNNQSFQPTQQQQQKQEDEEEEDNNYEDEDFEQLNTNQNIDQQKQPQQQKQQNSDRDTIESQEPEKQQQYEEEEFEEDIQEEYQQECMFGFQPFRPSQNEMGQKQQYESIQKTQESQQQKNNNNNQEEDKSKFKCSQSSILSQDNPLKPKKSVSFSQDKVLNSQDSFEQQNKQDDDKEKIQEDSKEYISQQENTDQQNNQNNNSELNSSLDDSKNQQEGDLQDQEYRKEAKLYLEDLYSNIGEVYQKIVNNQEEEEVIKVLNSQNSQFKQGTQQSQNSITSGGSNRVETRQSQQESEDIVEFAQKMAREYLQGKFDKIFQKHQQQLDLEQQGSRVSTKNSQFDSNIVISTVEDQQLQQQQNTGRLSNFNEQYQLSNRNNDSINSQQQINSQENLQTSTDRNSNFNNNPSIFGNRSFNHLSSNPQNGGMEASADIFISQQDLQYKKKNSVKGKKKQYGQFNNKSSKRLSNQHKYHF